MGLKNFDFAIQTALTLLSGDIDMETRRKVQERLKESCLFRNIDLSKVPDFVINELVEAESRNLFTYRYLAYAAAESKDNGLDDRARDRLNDLLLEYEGGELHEEA